MNGLQLCERLLALRSDDPILLVSGYTDEIDVERKMYHAAHAVHGSVYFKALDDAAFFAANSLVEKEFVLTTAFTVYLFQPVTAGSIKAIGRVTHQTGRLFFAESTLEDHPLSMRQVVSTRPF